MTTNDKAGSKVYLGAVDRSWIAGAIISLAVAAVTWAYKIDSRQSIQETRHEELAQRQGETVSLLQRLTDAAGAQRSHIDQEFPRIDQRLADIERRLDRMEADDEGVRPIVTRKHKDSDG